VQIAKIAPDEDTDSAFALVMLHVAVVVTFFTEESERVGVAGNCADWSGNIEAPGMPVTRIATVGQEE